MPYTIDVGIGSSIEYGVAVIQSHVDDGARDRVRHFLIDAPADVCQSSHVVTASMNNTADVLAVKGYFEYSQLRYEYFYSSHQSPGLVIWQLVTCP